MSEKHQASGKSAWLRIAGDQAFNTYALIAVSTIATIGTLSIYVGYNPTNFPTILAILVIAQVGALSPIFVIAPLAKRIESNGNRFAVVITTFILANVIRSILLDLLLVKWGFDSESKLAFRLYSNVVFLTILYVILAWISDFINENFAALSERQSLAADLTTKFYGVAQVISEARNYGSRELMIEVGALNSALEVVPPEFASETQTKRFIKQLSEVTQSVVLKLQLLERSYPNQKSVLAIAVPVKFSTSKVLSAATYSTPYPPRLMGGLSFIALSGWLGYFIDRATALQWAAYLGVYGFIIYWLYSKLLVPFMRRFKPVTRFAIYEVSLVPFTFFWLALLGYYAGDDSTTYGIAATNSISVFVFANLATFISGALIVASENRIELENTVSTLQLEVNKIEAVKQREDLIWRELFASDISKSPTTATVQIRETISGLDKQAFENVQEGVLATWHNVDKLLEH